MKSFFKSVFVSIFAILALGFVTSANANCISGCPDSPSTTTQTFQVGGSANFGGNGMAVFSGKEGYTLVEKTGAAGVDIKMNTEGNLCGLACQNGSFKFNGYANEHVTASAGAKGNQSGVASQVKNSGAAYGAVNFSLKK